jgi:putative hydrolase
MTESQQPAVPDVNVDIAERFREAADLLEAQEASPFRVRAYRQAASTLTQLDRSVESLHAEDGREGLQAIANIGASLTDAIVEILQTGRWRYLERLRGAVTPESVFQSIAGIGPELAERVHDELGIETLEELERAAHDGRLDAVDGFGERRVQAVRESLDSRLRRRQPSGSTVPVGELLDIDREYRRKAEQDELRRIAPRRFNPDREAWLPILHTERDDRHYTALYSNTARAHDLDKTDDWVVIYLENDEEAQWTVVTETSGPLEGQRVVRGRERECRDHYADDAEFPAH